MGIQIEEVKQIEYLGATISQKLTWNLYVQKLRKKLNSISLLFYNLKKFLPSNLLLELYREWYEFCMGTSCPKLHETTLRTTQNFSVKVISEQQLSNLVYKKNENSTCPTAVHETTAKFLQKKIETRWMLQRRNTTTQEGH